MYEQCDSPSADIQNLRSIMERMRSNQDASGLEINLARFDAETDGINNEFLSSFLDILPVGPGYRGNRAQDIAADHFKVTDPINIRVTSTFGVHLQPDIYTRYSTLIIGEKGLPTNPAQSEILLVSWKREVGKDGSWQEPNPVVLPVVVSTEQWQKSRDTAIRHINQSYSHETLMDLFSSADKSFMITQEYAGLLGATVLSRVNVAGSNPVEHTPRRINRTYKQNFADDGRRLGFIYSEQGRSLRGSDFEDHDVMRHLEYLAAAYGVGDAFDEVKATREQAMPAHPAETILGHTDYRQTIEGAPSTKTEGLSYRVESSSGNVHP